MSTGDAKNNRSLAGETLQLTRKTGEQIASIPLFSSEAASFQGFTLEDWERFDKLQAMLESKDLQQSQQPDQHQETYLE